jgi:hypothetical protein
MSEERDECSDIAVRPTFNNTIDKRELVRTVGNSKRLNLEVESR